MADTAELLASYFKKQQNTLFRFVANKPWRPLPVANKSLEAIGANHRPSTFGWDLS